MIKCIILIQFLIQYVLLFCGYFNQLDGIAKFTSKNNLKIPGQIRFNNNGKAFTFFFFFKFEGEKNKNYELFHLEMLENEDEGNLDSIYNNLLNISYNFKDKENEELIITYAYSNSETKEFIIKNPEIFGRQWCYIVISLNYENDIGNISFNNFKGIVKNEEIKLDFYSFFYRKKYITYLGGFAKKVNNSVKFIGQIANLSLIMSYFINLDKLYLIVHDKKLDKFNTIYYKIQFNMYNKNDSPIIDGKIDGISYELPLDNITYYNNTGIGLSSNNTLTIKKLELSENDNIFKKVFFYFEILIQNDIQSEITFLEVSSKGNQDYFSISFIKFESNNKIKISTNNNEILLISDISFEINKLLQFQVGVFNINNEYTKLYISDLENINYSKDFIIYKGYDFNFLKDIVILPKDQSFQNNIIIYQIIIFDNPSNIIYKQNLKELESKNFKDISKKYKECFKNCDLLSDSSVYSFKCIYCNSSTVMNNGECVEHCDNNHKSINNRCVKCKTMGCLEADLTKFVLVKSENNDTSYFYYPENKLLNYLTEYADTAKLEITSLLYLKNYKYNKTFDEDTQKIHFNVTFYNDFENKTIMAYLENNVNIYDKNRTLIENTTVYNITSYLESKNNVKEKLSKEEESYRDQGKTLARTYLATQGIGILASIGTSSLANNKTILKQVLQNLIILQYVSFWLFYNTDMPKNVYYFIQSIFSEGIGISNIFESMIENMFQGNKMFDQYYNYPPPDKFKNEEVSIYFIINCGLVVAIHIAVLLIYSLILLINNFVTRKNVFGRFIIKAKQGFEYEYIFSFIFAFEIELFVFLTLNLIYPINKHPLYIFSYYLCIIYIVMVIWYIYKFVWVINKPFSVLNNEYFKSKYGLLYEEFKLKPVSVKFEFYNLIKNILFGISIVIFHNKPLLQVTSCFIYFFIYSLYLLHYQPFEDIFDNISTTITECLFTLGNLLFIALVIDDKEKILNENGRLIIGYILIYIIYFCLAFSLLLIVLRIIINIIIIFYEYCCKKDNIDDESVEEITYLNDENNNTRYQKYSKQKSKEDILKFRTSKPNYFG